MKKLFTLLVYLITLAVPAMIVQYYHHNIDPMTPEEIRTATIAGTLAMLILAVFTGGGKKPKVSSVKAPARTPKVKAPKVKIPNTPKEPKTRIIKDPATGAETLYHWNEKDTSFPRGSRCSPAAGG